MDQEQQGLSLRDALTSAMEKHRETDIDESTQTAAPASNTPSTDETAANEAAATRARDEAGRFAKTEKQGTTPHLPGQNAPGAVSAQSAAAAPVAQTVPPAVAPPSSWRKDRHEHFAKLDRETQDYILQREREYATGVSTYKTEAERARGLQSAIEPFLPDLQRHNIAPEQWISNLGQAHQMLALGSPQQKAQMFWKLASDYGVDLSQLGVQQSAQAQDPNFQWMQQQLHATKSQLDAIVSQQRQQQQLAEQAQQQQVERMIEQFRADTASYPHFETVRETMAELLQLGRAQDLKSAYDKAIRMHDDVWQSIQEAQRQSAEAERQRLAAEAAAKARGKAVSVKSATPSGQANAGEAKGRRAQLAEAFSVVGGGRV